MFLSLSLRFKSSISFDITTGYRALYVIAIILSNGRSVSSFAAIIVSATYLWFSFMLSIKLVRCQNCPMYANMEAIIIIINRNIDNLDFSCIFFSIIPQSLTVNISNSLISDNFSLSLLCVHQRFFHLSLCQVPDFIH